MGRKMAIFCDETGTHTCDYFAWGSVWCPLERVGELERVVDSICRKARRKRELKWSYGGSIKLRRALLGWFFRTPWVCFQSLLVRKETMHIFDDEQTAVAYRKLLCTMLTTCMDRFDRLPGGPRRFEVVVDEVGETTRSLTKREFRILAAASRKRRSRDFVANFRRVDSRTSRGIQLADLLIGAIRAAWEGKPSGSKGRVCKSLAGHLGWRDLRGVTRPNLKFNIWLHHDSFSKSPHLKSRSLRLRHPDGDPERIFDRLERRR